jgi:hypothetical protein
MLCRDAKGKFVGCPPSFIMRRPRVRHNLIDLLIGIGLALLFIILFLVNG